MIHTTHYPGGVGAVPIGTVIHPAAGGVYPNIQPQQQQQFYGQPASDLPPSYDNVAASFSNDVNPDSSSGPGEMTTVYNVK